MRSATATIAAGIFGAYRLKPTMITKVATANAVVGQCT